jgi:hypothetical protein
MKYTLFIYTICAVFIACKEHKHDAENPIMRQALNIQDEAIHIGMEVDSLILSRMAQGGAGTEIAKLQSFKKQIEIWKHNMVIVPGLAHDHDHAGHNHGDEHAGHDHGHDHSKEDVAAQITPEDQLKVQQEWKSAIVAIKDSLR